jgi:hypothetical protein
MQLEAVPGPCEYVGWETQPPPPPPLLLLPATTSLRALAVRDATTTALELLKSPSYASSPADARRAGQVLLRHMAKATQRRDMMVRSAAADDTQNQDSRAKAGAAPSPELAVWGYVKHKFARRAILTFDILRNLEPEERRRRQHTAVVVEGSHSAGRWHVGRGGGADGGSNDTAAAAAAVVAAAALDEVWTQLCDVETVVSLGGGPGNDLYGCVLWQQHVQQQQQQRRAPAVATPAMTMPSAVTATAEEGSGAGAATARLRELVVLDFVAEGWAPVVRRLDELLRRRHLRSLLGKEDASDVTAAATFVCAHCDLGLPLHAPANATARPFLRRAGLIICSYCLTETRGQWCECMRGVWDVVQPGTLFLCVEPTVWQHHELLRVLGIKPSPLRGSGVQQQGSGNTSTKLAEKNGIPASATARYWWLDGVDTDSDTVGPAAQHTTSGKYHKQMKNLRKSLRQSKKASRKSTEQLGVPGGGGCEEAMVRNGPGILLLEKPWIEPHKSSSLQVLPEGGAELIRQNNHE